MERPSGLPINFSYIKAIVKNKEYITGILLCIFCSICLVYGFNLLFIDQGILINNQINDILFRFRYLVKGREKENIHIIAIDINDSSIKNLHLNNWDRRIYGDITGLLNKAFVKAIVFDMLFPHETVPGNDQWLVEAVQDSENIFMPVIVFPRENKRESEGVLTNIKGIKPYLWYPAIIKNGNPPAATILTMNFEGLAREAVGMGHITGNPDRDGVYRRIPLLYRYGDGFIPALALSVACSYLEVNPWKVEVVFGEYIRLPDARFPGGTRQDIFIPVDTTGQMDINYSGPWEGSFTHYSCERVLHINQLQLDSKDNPLYHDFMDEVEGAVVFISDVSTYNQDFGQIPLEGIYPLVGLHMNILNSILTSNFLKPQHILLQVLITFIFFMILLLAAIFYKPVQFYVSASCVFLIFLLLNILLFFYANQLPRLFLPCLSYGLAFLSICFYRFIYKIKKINSELEIRIQERTKDLLEANKKLEQQDKEKTNLFATISHELRTPLTLVKAPLDGIVKGTYGKNLYFKSSLFPLMLRNCDKLLNHINNLLDFSSLELKLLKARPQKVDIRAITRFFISQLESLAKSNDIDLQFTDTTTGLLIAPIDLNLFEIAFFNVMSNAFKFTKPGGRITVKLETGPAGSMETGPGQEIILLSVIDTGTGIPLEKQRIIFERFRQAHNGTTGRYHGMGIGLSLVKGIMDLHNGDITVMSTPGEGSTFSLELPRITRLAPGEEAADLTCYKVHTERLTDLSTGSKENRESPVSTGGKTGKKIILIVEDNPDMLHFLSDLLDKNYCIYNATDGEDGLSKLEHIPLPDLILTDMMMPRMDGREFYNRVMEKDKFAQIPFIFLTALADADEKLEQLKLGAVDYILKPFSVEEVLFKVSTIIGREEKIKDSIKKDLHNRLEEVIYNDKKKDLQKRKKREILYNTYNITEREKEIIELALQGMLNKQIAYHLKISEKTIANHLGNIYKKLNVGNRIGLQNVFA